MCVSMKIDKLKFSVFLCLYVPLLISDFAFTSLSRSISIFQKTFFSWNKYYIYQVMNKDTLQVLVIYESKNLLYI